MNVSSTCLQDYEDPPMFLACFFHATGLSRCTDFFSHGSKCTSGGIRFAVFDKNSVRIARNSPPWDWNLGLWEEMVFTHCNTSARQEDAFSTGWRG
jgi:hypothetical protein